MQKIINMLLIYQPIKIKEFTGNKAHEKKKIHNKKMMDLCECTE